MLRRVLEITVFDPSALSAVVHGEFHPVADDETAQRVDITDRDHSACSIQEFAGLFISKKAVKVIAERLRHKIK